jgi:hypothetical protein
MNQITPTTAKATLTAALLTTLLLLRALASPAQTTYTSGSVDLVVSGTSTLHNWDMKSLKADCSATFISTGGHITGLTALTFSTPTGALKSDHTSMDNNAYKALKSDKNPAISYTMTTATITPAPGGALTVKCTGKLSIAGTVRDEDLVATVKPNADNTLAVTGSRAISMKDFNMQPPTFMMGAIKTGNDVTLTFSLTLKKS